jgi:hypothetical protein
MLRQRVSVRLRPELVEQLRRSLDISEEQRYGAARQFCHAPIISREPTYVTRPAHPDQSRESSTYSSAASSVIAQSSRRRGGSGHRRRKARDDRPQPRLLAAGRRELPYLLVLPVLLGCRRGRRLYSLLVQLVWLTAHWLPLAASHASASLPYSVRPLLVSARLCGAHCYRAVLIDLNHAGHRHPRPLTAGLLFGSRASRPAAQFGLWPAGRALPTQCRGLSRRYPGAPSRLAVAEPGEPPPVGARDLFARPPEATKMTVGPKPNDVLSCRERRRPQVTVGGRL